jgi:SRSO17 transposase
MVTTMEPPPRGSLPEFDSARAERFEVFAELFQPVFPRAAQFRWFKTYVRGLLQPGERKNVETIAAQAARLLPEEQNLAQALQHFVTESPWAADRLFATCRHAFGTRVDDPTGVWIVHEAVFPKKGQHSVGVQRQLARSIGRKVNCQIAVVLSQLGRNGYFPLATRLYLPKHWLRERRDLVEKAVPHEHRRPATKVEVALDLIDALHAEGRCPGRQAIVAADGYATAPDLIDGLANRGLGLAQRDHATSADVLAETRLCFDWLRTELGLDHFEGRTWVGWHHHVSLVFTAFAFLATARRAD